MQLQCANVASSAMCDVGVLLSPNDAMKEMPDGRQLTRSMFACDPLMLGTTQHSLG
jgi:hypothetical protein